MLCSSSEGHAAPPWWSEENHLAKRHGLVLLCGHLTECSNGHAAGNRGLRGTLRALCSMLLLHALSFFLNSKPLRRGCLLFMSGYAALMSAPAGCAALLADAPLLQLKLSSLRTVMQAVERCEVSSD